MTDFETWVLDNRDRVYRYWVYKRMFTPEEVDAKWSDQSCYVDDKCSFGVIKEAVELPDGDVLLGFIDPNDEGSNVEGSIFYYKLSQIELAYFQCDQEQELDEQPG